MPTAVTEESPSVLANRYRAGESIQAIARATGIPEKRVSDALREAGVQPTTKRCEPLPRPALLDAYFRRGLSSQAVAAELGCSSSKVRDDLRHHGIALRPRRFTRGGLAQLDSEKLRKLYEDRRLTLGQIAEASRRRPWSSGARGTARRRDPDADDRFLREVAPGLVRSIYTDAVVLGLLQRLAYNGLADELADLTADTGSYRLRAVERRLSTIRNTIWGAHTTSHGFANDILQAYQGQHQLRELVDEVHMELADAGRLADLISSRRVELLLTMLTVVSAAAALAALWTGSGAIWFRSAIAIAVFATGAILYFRFARRE